VRVEHGRHPGRRGHGAQLCVGIRRKAARQAAGKDNGRASRQCLFIHNAKRGVLIVPDRRARLVKQRGTAADGVDHGEGPPGLATDPRE
jgi:hypothetical protein